MRKFLVIIMIIQCWFDYAIHYRHFTIRNHCFALEKLFLVKEIGSIYRGTVYGILQVERECSIQIVY